MSEIPTAAREAVWERQDRQCARCGNRGYQIHHRIRRREGGHGVANLVGLCGSCHTWAHGHPQQAVENGFIVSTSVDDVAEVPIKTFMGWARFTHDKKVVLI